jgi:hypothetical protein
MMMMMIVVVVIMTTVCKAAKLQQFVYLLGPCTLVTHAQNLRRAATHDIGAENEPQLQV